MKTVIFSEVEYGHRICPTPEETNSRIFNRKWIISLGSLREKVGSIMFKKKFFLSYASQNIILRNWATDNLPGNMILVSGHVHLAEYTPSMKYINLGIIRHGFASYLLIQDNKIQLIETNYK